MKKLFILFILFFISPVMALYNSTISTGCINNVLYPNTPTNRAKMIAVFQINSYTCDSGYFLPANTDGCQPCPTGYTCSGGTFNFNERQSQGIKSKTNISNTIANGCSDNLLYTNGTNYTRIQAIFEPVTVTLNFDDGNGNTTSGSCTYDGLVNLPEPPTRPGYTFNGWTVQKNNE